MDNTPAQRMVDAARAWLDSLSASQRRAAADPWPSDDERRRWYYTPTNHGGLPLATMSPAQQGRAMQLLSAGLSQPGYTTAATIMGLENVLDRTENWRLDWGRERGRDPQLYWLKVFGEPGLNGTWSWRFGGHHVSVQHVVSNGEVVSSSPCFLGADPAESPLLGGHILRPLGAAEDLARELVRSLDEGQLARALISSVAPLDIVGGNRAQLREGDEVIPLPDLWRGKLEPRLHDLAVAIHEGGETKAGLTLQHHHEVSLTVVPKGVAALTLNASQRELLRAVLDVFLARIPDELAAREAQKFAGSKLDEVHFAWAGGFERGEPHYYRLQGPHLLAEYDNAQRDVNHIHTVWRDPSSDFGDDLLGRHRSEFHAETLLF
ncbi:hypothetical protein A5724_13390 [Mycobacterium sp. ACS1612]|uniref:DUF3500 domain-containing protein n=1 Tax=Mycobacterium sp. ACS1612 TaxID=1834117 RepID=UPI000801B81C|nr:DUF3500 domain-containing protein [Mycobacterium sp. ACS1612]OBF36196.1 hypothetical protein A5724_13390 [Mycobacterium sp. ACS1612]